MRLDQGLAFEHIVGHERVKRILSRAVHSDRLAHALIFSGPEGVGKRTLALGLAAALNCEEPERPCGGCASCRRIAAGSHPDIRVLSPSGNFIKIDQLRALKREIYFHPFEAKKRVFVIDEADRMREEAANSLLKVLEEPPLSAHLFLVTPRPSALLATIRSRCQTLEFQALPFAPLADRLGRDLDLDSDRAELLARLSGCSLGVALEFDLDHHLELREQTLELFRGVLGDSDGTHILDGAQELAKDRDEMSERLLVLFYLLRDLVAVKSGCDSRILINRDIEPSLRRIAKECGGRSLALMMERVEEVRREVGRFINRQIATEALLFGARSCASPDMEVRR